MSLLAHIKTHSERKPTPTFETKVIRDSKPNFRIKPNLNVRRICPKMLWKHYLVGVGHLAKYGTNWLSIV